VQVNVDGAQVVVRGPKGQLTRSFSPEMAIVLETTDGRNQVKVERPTDQPRHRALHGLTRALLANMVTGVSEGFRRELQIEGTGYRAEMQGDALVLMVGYSHPVRFEPPAGITFSVDRAGRIVTVEGVDKEQVGELAARIRRVRPPEPYLGKGIRYAGEQVRRKAGKAGAS
jgi:large subunit ribosomal protein L6